MINILTLDFFQRLHIEAKRGHQNSGGGMGCLMNSTRATLLQRYPVNMTSDIAKLRGDIVIIDCIYIAMYHMQNAPEDRSTSRYIYDLLTSDRDANPHRKYILWCAEKSFLRLEPELRKELSVFVDSIYVTCPYIRDLFLALNAVPTGLLSDGIDEYLFKPAPKEMTVTAVGALKHIKNIDWILEVYHLLEGKNIKRIYMGGADLWSVESRPEDLSLISRIEAATDEYFPNASPVDVAYQNAHAAFAVNDTWHDCSSRANEELLLSGVISIHGQHPTFESRPGFTVREPQEAVDVMAELTDDFTKLPDPQLHEDSRNWALKHVSSTKFMQQFENLMRSFL